MYQQTFNCNKKKKDPKIFDELASSDTGILYWQQETLEEITKLSGPLAASNEFQIHYWALVVRMRFKDNSIIDIAFPTTIFNYEQEVTPSHIDFELKDVSKVSDALKPVHNSIINKLLPKLRTVFVDSEYYSIEYLSVPLNTMHRHPTGVASFSGTDLNKDHEKDTGIVFPLKTGRETPSFSSIIYNNPVRLIHTEYRTATGDVSTKEGIQYYKDQCATFVKGPISEVSMAQKFLGHKPENTSYLVDKTNIADIKPLLEIINEIEYTPNTQFIKADNVKKKTYTTKSYFPKTNTIPNSKKDSKSTDKDTKLQTEYDTETKELVKTITGLTFYNLKALKSMQFPQLQYHLMTIKQKYYQDVENITVTDYVDLKKQELLDQIIEVQNLILEEVHYVMSQEKTNEPTKEDLVLIDEKRKILISFGAPEETINQADDLTVSRWYTELTLYDEVF